MTTQQLAKTQRGVLVTNEWKLDRREARKTSRYEREMGTEEKEDAGDCDCDARQSRQTLNEMKSRQTNVLG